MEEEKVSADALAEEFLKLKDGLGKLNKIYEGKRKVFDDRMNEITQTLNVLCEEQNASSIRTAHGTVIRSVTKTYNPLDWGAIHDLVVNYKAPYLLWKRINNTAMDEFLAEHPDAYPPGLNVNRSYTVSVRRPTNRKSIGE